MPRVPSRPPHWLVVAALVVGALGFSAGAVVNQGIGRFLRLPEDAVVPAYEDAATPAEGGAEGEAAVEARVTPAERGPRALSRKEYADIIVRRNLFDSTAVYNPEAEKRMGSDECKDSSVKLLATVVADPAEYSSALISDGGKGAKARGYTIGDELGGEGRIARIDQKKVCLDAGGCICMDSKSAVAKTEPAPTTTADGQVEKLADNKYRVDPGFIDEQMKSIETLATQVRVVPHKGDDGQIDGYRLSAIRRGSLFDKLGIKNGDIVHSVNGQPLTSAEGALSTYQTLQSERAFSFEISRRNQKQTLEYEVR